MSFDYRKILIVYTINFVYIKECQGWILYNTISEDIKCARIYDSKRFQGNILDFRENDKLWNVPTNFRLQSASVRDGCSLLVSSKQGHTKILSKNEEWIWGWNHRVATACCECNGCNGEAAKADLNCAKLYQHEKCNGCSGYRLFVSDGDDIRSFSILDNMIKSLVVEPGCTLTVFKDPNFATNGFNFTGNHNILGEKWNSAISSAKCRCESSLPTTEMTTSLPPTPPVSGSTTVPVPTASNVTEPIPSVTESLPKETTTIEENTTITEETTTTTEKVTTVDETTMIIEETTTIENVTTIIKETTTTEETTIISPISTDMPIQEKTTPEDCIDSFECPDKNTEVETTIKTEETTTISTEMPNEETKTPEDCIDSFECPDRNTEVETTMKTEETTIMSTEMPIEETKTPEDCIDSFECPDKSTKVETTMISPLSTEMSINETAPCSNSFECPDENTGRMKTTMTITIEETTMISPTPIFTEIPIEETTTPEDCSDSFECPDKVTVISSDKEEGSKKEDATNYTISTSSVPTTTERTTSDFDTSFENSEEVISTSTTETILLSSVSINATEMPTNVTTTPLNCSDSFECPDNKNSFSFEDENENENEIDSMTVTTERTTIFDSFEREDENEDSTTPIVMLSTVVTTTEEPPSYNHNNENDFMEFDERSTEIEESFTSLESEGQYSDENDDTLGTTMPFITTTPSMLIVSTEKENDFVEFDDFPLY